MADFYQTGVVTTLHRLKPNNIERLEADLETLLPEPAHRLGPAGAVLGVRNPGDAAHRSGTQAGAIPAADRGRAWPGPTASSINERGASLRISTRR